MNRYQSEVSGVAVEDPAAEAARPRSPGGSTRASEAPALADRLFEVLPRTVRRMRHETRSRFGSDLTVPQMRAVLFVRRNRGASLSQLADHLGVSRPAASVLMDTLVRQGLAQRSPDPDERRRVRLTLTPDGDTIAGAARIAARGWLSGALAELPPDDRATLASAVAILDRLTDARP